MGSIIGFFFAGLFLFNGIPHFIQGVCGKEHMTPFSRVSRPVTNVIWGFSNFIIGEILIYFSKSGPMTSGQVVALWVGGFVISIYLAYFWSNPEARLPWHK